MSDSRDDGYPMWPLERSEKMKALHDTLRVITLKQETALMAMMELDTDSFIATVTNTIARKYGKVYGHFILTQIVAELERR